MRTGAIFIVFFLMACGHAAVSSPTAQSSPAMPARFNVLVFSKTAGFRHDSIPAGIAAIQRQALQRGFTVDASEDADVFRDERLKSYKAVVFLSTTGDVLNDTQQAAFERFIRGGGGFVGIHSATDTEYDWPFYGSLVGAYFAGHPDIQSASVVVEDAANATTSGLPRSW